MKSTIPILFLLLVYSAQVHGQITSPVTKANFGIDADLRANFFNGAAQGSGDDWFRQAGAGTGQFVIDTTGAATIVARYSTDPAFRRLPFFRTMRYPGFTVVNNRLLLDAVFIRDYHGDDSTVFASGSNKNGDNPLNWSCPVSQGIPDKNDILDMMVHVRRAGPNNTDSLWMMGGLSLDNTTGNRYFDFEMYQTDIYYDRSSRQFYGYGTDAGHTSWEFDAAGNITRPGDIIFSAEYQSSSLSFVEARIWVNRNMLSVTPVSFDWSGEFDGAFSGATYGYASIRPKTAGAYYTGLQCTNNTWGGPFGVVLQDESVVTDYDARQFVEFSVNLTKLGLDPVTLLGGNACGMPFRRVLVKTRASASFTAELKDFVGPFDFFLAPRVNVLTETPFICTEGSVAEIHVTNPVATSVYEWKTLDGNIIGNPDTSSIHADKPGTYIVTQYLQAGCSAYATDTIELLAFPVCDVLSVNITGLKGNYAGNKVQLSWQLSNGQPVQYFIVERSTDGVHFEMIAQVTSFRYLDLLPITMSSGILYYRIRPVTAGKTTRYSNVLKITTADINFKKQVAVFPNPAKDQFQVQLYATGYSKIKMNINDAAGKQINTKYFQVQPGTNVMLVSDLATQPEGIYLITIYCEGSIIQQKLIHKR